MKKNYIYILAVVLLIASCTSEDDLVQEQLDLNPLPTAPTYDAGSLDFTTYVAVGNSITAGLMDAALYTTGQNAAFPNQLAAVFAQVGGGPFVQPDINAENGFNTSLNDLSMAFESSAATFGKFVLDVSIPGPVPTTPGDAMTMFSDPASVNNLGVPGMRLVEIGTAGYGTLNPFYTRFALNPASTSVLEQAIAKNPTFMTMWLGNNELLQWATGGGTGAIGIDLTTGNPDPTSDAIPGTLVSTTSFNAAIDQVVATLGAALPNTEVVMVNLPNMTVTPFFQAVPYNAIPLDEATAAAAQAGFDGYNAILANLASDQVKAALAGFGFQGISAEEAAKRNVTFSAGQNAVLVVDDALTDITADLNILLAAGQITAEQLTALTPLVQARQLKSAADDAGLVPFGLPSEILTLSAGAVLGTLADPTNPASVIGVGVPLGDNFTLTTDEIGLLLLRTIDHNTKLAEVAAANSNIALVDANSIITNAAIMGGVTVDGQTLAPDFSPNGIYSTDGIHPNPRGHAIIANEILSVIESTWGADLPTIDVLSQRSVEFQ